MTTQLDYFHFKHQIVEFDECCLTCIDQQMYLYHFRQFSCSMMVGGYGEALVGMNVDIKFSAHDAFMEGPSSGTLKIERLESQIT